MNTLPAHVSAAVRCGQGQGVVHLKAGDVKLGDVMIVGDQPLAGETSAVADVNLSGIGVVRMVMAAVDIPAQVLLYLSPMPPRSRHTKHESGGHPFCSI